MIEFMHGFNTVVIFMIIIISTLILLGAFFVEVFDKVTGADAKRQAELARLRLLEAERDDH